MHLSKGTLFFSSSILWNTSLGMFFVLLPLYASELGMSGVAIGGLIALPAVVQAVINFIGGALSDRLGGKTASNISFIFSVVTGLSFALGSSYPAMLAAQTLFVLARGLYWPANWALCSQLPGEQPRNLARLNTLANAGQILGTALSGIIAAHFGFRAGFWTATGLVVASVLIFQPLDMKKPARSGERRSIGRTYLALARRADIQLCILCAFMSNVTMALSTSFYPILIIDSGNGSDVTGWIMAVRGIGSMLAGLALARFVRVSETKTTRVSALMSSIPLILSGLFTDPWLQCLLIFILGLGTGMMSIYTQTLISRASSPESRGSAMAMPGLGWAIGFFTIPLAMGGLKDAVGLRPGFIILGIGMVALSLALPRLQRWADVKTGRLAAPAAA